MDKKDIRKYRWVSYTKGYLKSATLLVQYLLNSNCVPNRGTYAAYTYNYEPLALISLFYQIRHILELTVKTAITFDNITPPQTHHSKTLKRRLQEKYKKSNTDISEIPEFIEQKYLKSVLLKKSILDAYSHPNAGVRLAVSRFVKIHNKYWGSKFYKENFGFVPFSRDNPNTFFRYPEKDGKQYKLDFSKLHKINKKILREIEDDLLGLEWVLGILYVDSRESF
ncbi:MAG: hypothetical protein AAB428_01825 [Patescibacteria group bacterium]